MRELDLNELTSIVNDTNTRQNMRVLEFGSIPGFVNFVSNDPHVILHATDPNGFAIVIHASDPVSSYETIDTCVEKVKMDLILKLHENCGEGNDIPPFYMGELNQNGLLHRMYMQDFIVQQPGSAPLFVRQMMSFFLEPKTRCFYQIAINAPAMSYPPGSGIIPGRYDKQSPDPLAMQMLRYLNSVVTSVHYANNNNVWGM